MREAIATGCFLLLTLSHGAAQEAVRPFPNANCIDEIVATATVDPKLDSKFFHSTESSYPWHIVEHDDGSVENTFGDSIDVQDLLRTEHTSNCVSSHQGEHAMSFCDAVRNEAGLELIISGGMPAYASSLRVKIDSDLRFQCNFHAVYPGPSVPLKWRIIKKSLQLRSGNLKAGNRCYGRILVEFEEVSAETGHTELHKIEGFLKPVIQGKTR